MTHEDIAALRNLWNALTFTFEAWCKDQEAKMQADGSKIATLPAQAAEPVKPQTIAPKDPLDEGQNPWIRQDPAVWKGESMKGNRADECPIDYLEVYLAALTNFAAIAAKKAKDTGDQKAQAASDKAAAEARVIDTIISQKRARSAGQKRTA